MKPRERAGRNLEPAKERPTSHKEVKVSREMTGKLTRGSYGALRAAIAIRTRHIFFLEESLAVDILVEALQKDRGLEIHSKQYTSKTGVLLGSRQELGNAYQIVSEANIDRIAQAVKRVSEGISTNFKHWVDEGYGARHATSVYFDVESTYFDILVFEE